MKLSDYIEISDATTESELLGRMVAFAHRLDFEQVNAFRYTLGSTGRLDLVQSIGTLKFGSLELAHSREGGVRHPVAKLVRERVRNRNLIPIVSHRQLYVDSEAMDLWEEGISVGYGNGIEIITMLPGNEVLQFGIDRVDCLPSRDKLLVDLMATCQLLSVHLHSSMNMINSVPDAPVVPVRLTPREGEILKWAMENKSAWATGQILGLSENTIKFHMKNSMRKLGATSRHQAILRAINLGLLQ